MLTFIIIKIRECKFKNTIFNKKHLMIFFIIEIIVFKMFIKNHKITF